MERKLFKLLEKDNYTGVVRLMYRLSHKEVIKIMHILSEKDLIEICSRLKKNFLAEIICTLPVEKKQIILGALNDKKLNKLLDDLSVGKVVEMIEISTQELATKMLKKEEVLYLLNRQNYAILKPLLSSLSLSEIVKIFEWLKPAKRVDLFRILQKDTSIKIFSELSFNIKQSLLEKLTDEEIKDIMAGLVLDKTMVLIKEMPFNIIKRIMSQSSIETREYIEEILSYPKDSVGQVMARSFISVDISKTVKQALQVVKDSEIPSDAVYNVYVTEEKKLVGIVSVRKLLKADADYCVSDIMDKNYICAQSNENKKNVAAKLFDYNLTSIPIINEKALLVGVLTIDEAVYILKQKTTEQISKMNAIVPLETPYLKTSIWQIWKIRIPWLLVLLVSATFTGLILNSYETRLNAISPVLFACVPMMMDTGGNCGSQSSVTIIRSLSLGEITPKDWFKIMVKEISASIFLGLTLAVACFTKLILIDNLLFGYRDYTIVRSFVVSLALFLTVIFAKLVGCLLPLIAKKLKLDPAVMVSPFITTIVDSISLILFCSLSVAILN